MAKPSGHRQKLPSWLEVKVGRNTWGGGGVQERVSEYLLLGSNQKSGPCHSVLNT